ncbi:hypothetical protein [Tunturibacter empetritectus]|uniref:Uncharacterized protein n=1 Tax=Tunturiibacter empetritectus TaxID=3069691 RepID=A0A7W8ILP4_9BACT|nr:hypothetical protein [Edaphobacter lichenicola]MBB5319417.1 hypothetical protein [Edaphobacter lichenicola]
MRDNRSQDQNLQKRRAKLSIWFFCGILMLADGLVLLSQGIFERFGHEPATVLANLQPTLWWGVLLTLFGGSYTVRFRPVAHSVD